jgi:hypothetical protein
MSNSKMRMFHVKQPLTLDNKHRAYMGFHLGAKKALKHVTLASVERSGNELCFTVLGHTDTGITHIHIPRVLTRDRWVDAIFRCYLAGQEAGEAATSWWKRNGFAGEAPPIDHPIDPDFQKWTDDATAA